MQPAPNEYNLDRLTVKFSAALYAVKYYRTDTSTQSGTDHLWSFWIHERITKTLKSPWIG